ncbi:MAG: 50S ribosomal protein L30 [Deltaproteobacteria bacterium RIFCSPHIGHO2_02_FULL_40_11]|nr:MAG: 50S ribosomal protein L30 [Deltaproteobacteria bacterium RIFCSPHIGHO2_02_FULL_40_11]
MTSKTHKKKDEAVSAKKLKVTLLRSPIGTTERKRQTLRGLGLTKINKTMELKNSPQVRGMINRVIQMVRTEFVS